MDEGRERIKSGPRLTDVAENKHVGEFLAATDGTRRSVNRLGIQNPVEQRLVPVLTSKPEPLYGCVCVFDGNLHIMLGPRVN